MFRSRKTPVSYSRKKWMGWNTVLCFHFMLCFTFLRFSHTMNCLEMCYFFRISNIHFGIYKNEQNQTKCVAVLLTLWKHKQANPKTLFCLQAQGVFLAQKKQRKVCLWGFKMFFWFPEKTLGMCGYTYFLGVFCRSTHLPNFPWFIHNLGT